jgi:hypothetical protein
MIFIVFSNLCLRETGLRFSEKKEHRQDFLLRYDSLNSLFQTYFVMSATTLAASVTQYFS